MSEETKIVRSESKKDQGKAGASKVQIKQVDIAIIKAQQEKAKRDAVKKAEAGVKKTQTSASARPAQASPAGKPMPKSAAPVGRPMPKSAAPVGKAMPKSAVPTGTPMPKSAAPAGKPMPKSAVPLKKSDVQQPEKAAEVVSRRRA